MKVQVKELRNGKHICGVYLFGKGLAKEDQASMLMKYIFRKYDMVFKEDKVSDVNDVQLFERGGIIDGASFTVTWK